MVAFALISLALVVAILWGMRKPRPTDEACGCDHDHR